MNLDFLETWARPEWRLREKLFPGAAYVDLDGERVYVFGCVFDSDVPVRFVPAEVDEDDR